MLEQTALRLENPPARVAESVDAGDSKGPADPTARGNTGRPNEHRCTGAACDVEATRTTSVTTRRRAANRARLRQKWAEQNRIPWTVADGPADVLTGRQNAGHKRIPFDADTLRRVFDYDPTTGVFLWREPKGTKKRVGQVAGAIRPDGYVHLCYDYHLFLAHRAAWVIVHGVDTPMILDHINGNRSDNRIANLREADWKLNSANTAARRQEAA